MKKSLVFFLIMTLFLFQTFSLGVDTEELKKGTKVEFENFGGSYTDTFTREEVYQIGRDLADRITQSNTRFYYPHNKYFIVHAFDEAQIDKFGADVLSIESNVAILHINWIRSVLTGYLERRYGYSLDNAGTLAIFITYYNALHRKDLAYFNARYQTVVLEHLDAANAGLSLSYKEWAGLSRIVVPLTENAEAQDITSLDTSLLTEDQIIEQLQQQEDKGIQERQDMVDIKEQQLQQNTENLEQQKQQADQQQQDLAQQQEQLAQQQKELQQLEQQQADTQDQEQKAQLEQQIEQKQQDIIQQETQIQQQQDQITQQQQQIEQQETKIEQQQQDIQQDKDSINKDEKILEVTQNPEQTVEQLEKQATTEPVAGNYIYYMKVKEFLTNGHYNNDLYKIDLATGQVSLKAPESNICGHEYVVIDKVGVLVITHTDNHSGHYLSLLDLDTLEPDAEGQDLIYFASFLRVKDDYIYAIVWDGANSYYLGKFDLKLNLVAQSAEKIDKDTIVYLYGNKIYINDVSKDMIIFDPGDLSKQGIVDLSGF